MAANAGPPRRVRQRKLTAARRRHPGAGVDEHAADLARFPAGREVLACDRQLGVVPREVEQEVVVQQVNVRRRQGIDTLGWGRKRAAVQENSVLQLLDRRPGLGQPACGLAEARTERVVQRFQEREHRQLLCCRAALDALLLVFRTRWGPAECSQRPLEAHSPNRRARAHATRKKSSTGRPNTYPLPPAEMRKQKDELLPAFQRSAWRWTTSRAFNLASSCWRRPRACW